MVNSASLKDLLTFTRDGEWGKAEPFENSVQMHIIRGTDFASARYGSLSSIPIRFIPKHIAERKQLEPYDILIETAGGTKDQPTGRTVLLKPHLFDKAKHPITCASFSRFLRVKTELAFPEYVFWFLQYLYETGQMEPHQVQHTGVARFQYTNFAETVEIPLPPLDEQKAIAHILGTLDDKIELNQQMNRTLEAIARALFKSWFIDFDPVRAKLDGRQPAGTDAETAALFPAEFEDSVLGQIPKGWSVGVADDVISILSGGTPKTSVSEYWGGDIPWFSVKDAPTDSDVYVLETEKYITEAGVNNSSTQILPEGTTIITARGTVGRHALVGVPMAMNQSCYGIRGKNGYNDIFIYYFLRSAIVSLQQQTHGTVFETITRQTFTTVKSINPPTAIAQAFDEEAQPLMHQIRSNLLEIRSLTSIRDALLPKLLSGEIRVKEAEKIVVEVA